MLLRMRTTIHLNDILFGKVKTLAAKRNKTLTALIEESLRRLLERYSTHKNKDKKLTNFCVVKGGRLNPGVDLDDTSALLDLMEEKK